MKKIQKTMSLSRHEKQRKSLKTLNFPILCGIYATFLLLSGSSAVVADTKSSIIRSQIESVQALSGGGFLSEGNDDETSKVWLDWMKESENNGFTESIKNALSNPRWWRAWERLSTSTRDNVVSLLLPLLVPTQGWTLHCFDAYRLCQADSNCRWKYWNYMSKCNSGTPLNEWNVALEWDTSDTSTLPEVNRASKSVANKRVKRNSRARQSHQRTKKKSRRRLGLRSANRRPSQYKRSWRKVTKNLHYWMGKRWLDIYYKHGEEHNEKCPPRCLDALLMLNKTVYGALLARCDCQIKNIFNDTKTHNTKRSENMCEQHQGKALGCRPRLFRPRNSKIGCTEARVRCESNPTCKTAQDYFLLKCSQVINGITCTNECRSAMATLASTTKHYNNCVCDGNEKPVCLKIRSNFVEHCANHNGCSTNAKRTNDRDCTKSSSNSAVSQHNKLLSVLDFALIAMTFYMIVLAT